MSKDSMKKMLELVGDDELSSLVSEIEQGFDRAHRIKDHADRQHSTVKPALDKNRWQKLKKRVEEAEAEFREGLDRAKEGIALVLNGGGGKGCYQVGACRVLKDYFAGEETPGGRKITAVAGTSVGALNGAMFLAGCDSEDRTPEDLWTTLVPEKLFAAADSIGEGFRNSAYLEELIWGSGMPGKLPEWPLFLVTAFNRTTGYPEDFIMNRMNPEKQVDCLLASAAFPFVFDKKTMDRADYLDGGLPVFGDNSPFAPLYHLGFRRFIVIHTQSAEEARDNAWAPLLNMKINEEKYYGGAVFVHIYPSRDMGDLLEGTLNFSADYIRQGMELGKKDMEAHLDELAVLNEEPDEYTEIHLREGRKYFSMENLLENL